MTSGQTSISCADDTVSHAERNKRSLSGRWARLITRREDRTHTQAKRKLGISANQVIFRDGEQVFRQLFGVILFMIHV